MIAGKTRQVDLARSGSKYFATVLCAGFDAMVNERANRMTWPKGQMRYNLADPCPAAGVPAAAPTRSTSTGSRSPSRR